MRRFVLALALVAGCAAPAPPVPAPAPSPAPADTMPIPNDAPELPSAPIIHDAIVELHAVPRADGLARIVLRRHEAGTEDVVLFEADRPTCTRETGRAGVTIECGVAHRRRTIGFDGNVVIIRSPIDVPGQPPRRFSFDPSIRPVLADGITIDAGPPPRCPADAPTKLVAARFDRDSAGTLALAWGDHGLATVGFVPDRSWCRTLRMAGGRHVVVDCRSVDGTSLTHRIWTHDGTLYAALHMPPHMGDSGAEELVATPLACGQELAIPRFEMGRGRYGSFRMGTCDEACSDRRDDCTDACFERFATVDGEIPPAHADCTDACDRRQSTCQQACFAPRRGKK